MNFQDALQRIFKPGVAEWLIEGEAGTVKSKYDIIKNRALDIEPGAESAELKQLMADCPYKGTRIVHVHALRWSYYLAADAGLQDTRIGHSNAGLKDIASSSRDWSSSSGIRAKT